MAEGISVLLVLCLVFKKQEVEAAKSKRCWSEVARELCVGAVGKVLVPVWGCPHPARLLCPAGAVPSDASSMTWSLLLDSQGFVGLFGVRIPVE